MQTCRGSPRVPQSIVSVPFMQEKSPLNSPSSGSVQGMVGDIPNEVPKSRERGEIRDMLPTPRDMSPWNIAKNS